MNAPKADVRPSPPIPAMQKVLIAEKDPETREHYASLVKALGHRPLVCEDAIAVLDCASAHPEIDAIVMDLDLPGAWGEQLLEVLSGLDHLAQAPIIVVSAPRSRTELMRLLVMGMHQWFEKPPESEELMGAIRTCLERSAALDIFDVDGPLPAASQGAEGGSWLMHA